MGVGALSGWTTPPQTFGLESNWAWIVAALPLWVFGALCGLLLPRPRFLEGGSRTSALLWSTPPGTAFRRLALLFHGAVLVRDVWQHSIAAGANAYLLAIWGWLVGSDLAVPLAAKGERTQSDAAAKRRLSTAVVQKQPSSRPSQRIASQSTADWYVTEADLQFFKEHCEQNVPLEGATQWEQQMDKEFTNFNYTAWRRILPSGKAEYKSLTLCLDATAEEFTDFYLDDDMRPNWDTMVSEHDVVENGSPADRCQVVHWIRSFPFAFITDREYVIARRQFRDDNGCIYVMTKSIEHPRVPVEDGVIRMDVFYSMWRSRTVPCPRGSGKPACETVLLHHEQFKIPERLARFAVSAGMAGFIKKMGPSVLDFISSRRQRCDPFKPDAEAYGVKQMARSSSAASSLASTTCTEYTEGDSSLAGTDARFPQRAGRARRRRKPKANPARRLAVASLGVAAVVVALQRGHALPRLFGGIGGIANALRPRQRRQLTT